MFFSAARLARAFSLQALRMTVPKDNSFWPISFRSGIFFESELNLSSLCLYVGSFIFPT